MRSINHYSFLKNSLTLLMAGVLLLMFSCTTEEAADVDELQQPKSDAPKIEGNHADDEEVYYMLPSALQIAHIYRKSGLKYFPGIGHDAANSNNYVSETSKLMNLGVYSADLCWVALNKQTQEELTYLKAMMDLSNDLGFGSVFSSGAFVDRFEKNVANEDSMIVILSQLQEKMDFYLQEAEMDDKSTIIFSGAWIESLYISLLAYKTEGKESSLSVRIQEQVNILEGLKSKLKAVYEPDMEVKTLITDLNALHFLISGFAFMKEVDKEVQIQVTEVSLTDLELDQLTAKIEEIRSRITKG